MRRYLPLAIIVLLASVLPQAQPSQATHLCGDTGSSFGAFSLISYDPADYQRTYARTMELAAFNRLFSNDSYFGLPLLETGPRQNRTLVTPYIPPVLLKAIGWIESGWAQADYSVPYGEIGPALVSHDCGYGIMQVTTGMQNTIGLPTPQQLMIGSHYIYNIARGARILADKWNLAPELRPVVGQSNPQIIEDWYYAVWGYNGFAFVNHPLNPRYPAWPRKPFSCGPSDDGFGHDRSQYPYQELVFGCSSHPPLVSGQPLWRGVDINLPDLQDPAIATALDPKNFACGTSPADEPNSSYCYNSMDIPTPLKPSGQPHSDPTQPEGDPMQLLGSPRLLVQGPADLPFTIVKGTTPPSYTITIGNAGTGLLSWTALGSHSWIKITPWQSVALGSTPSRMNVTVDTTKLLPGKHEGIIKIDAPYSNGGPRYIPISVVVRE